MLCLLSNDAASLPAHIQILPNGGSGFGKNDSAFLGPKYSSVSLGDGKPPADLLRPAALTGDADATREEFRKKLNDRFAKSRKSAATEAYSESYTQAERVVKQGEVFDVTKEDPKIADRYGRHDFGRHLLLARRLLEAGVTYVKVSHSNYDTHHENFDFHIEQLGEFDRPFAALLDDLADRGMLESTLVVVMSEFGRTPRINHLYGRDHWSKAWSVAMAGCGIKGGALIGKTNANGTAVTEREVNGGHLFHTYLSAVGVDSTKNFRLERSPDSDRRSEGIGNHGKQWRDDILVLDEPESVSNRLAFPVQLSTTSPRTPALDHRHFQFQDWVSPVIGPDPTTARLELELKHPRPLIGCRFDPSGRYLFVSSEDNTIQRLDLITGVKDGLDRARKLGPGNGVCW